MALFIFMYNKTAPKWKHSFLRKCEHWLSPHKCLPSSEFILGTDGPSHRTFGSITHFLGTHLYGLSFSIQFLYSSSLSCIGVCSNFSFDLSIPRPNQILCPVYLYKLPCLHFCIFSPPTPASNLILLILLFLLVLPHKPSHKRNNKLSVFNVFESEVLATTWAITCPGFTKAGPIPMAKSVDKTIWILAYISSQYLWLGSVNKKKSLVRSRYS